MLKFFFFLKKKYLNVCFVHMDDEHSTAVIEEKNGRFVIKLWQVYILVSVLSLESEIDQ